MIFKDAYKEEDLMDACCFAHFDPTLLKFQGFQTYHPLDLMNSPGIEFDGASFLETYSFGWGRAKSKKEVLKALAQTNNTMPVNWEVYTLDYGGLPALIVIKGKLCDGFHRAMYCYLMGEMVIGASFK